MGPLTHIWRMRVLLQLILPLLVQGKSIVKERNGVIKQALIPTLVNIIGHARMQEHGIGDDMDGLLNFMDEEKILDPFLSWLAWFTNLVVDKEEGKSEEEAEESRSIVKERNDVIKQALTPTLVNIVSPCEDAGAWNRHRQPTQLYGRGENPGSLPPVAWLVH